MRTTATAPTIGCAVGARACITQSPQATVLGSTDLSANVTQLIAHDQHTLLHPSAVCRSTAYPIGCTFTAYDTTRHATVAGTAKLLGIYTLTHTYVYELNYRATTAKPGGTRTPGAPKTGTSGV